MLFCFTRYYVILKKYESGIKIPGFRQNFQKYKKILKKEKIYLCIWLSVLKLKNHIMFVIHQQKNVLACILALITSLLKSRKHWPKFKKQQKFYFVYLLVSSVQHYM